MVLMSLELHEISEANHKILNPFTDEKLMSIGTAARVGTSTRILDLACGKGEMLSRWAQEFGSSGVGVDISDIFLAAARLRANELEVSDRVVFHEADASSYQPESKGFDVASCLGATWIGAGVTGTIELLRQAVDSDGLVLIGEPYWHTPPPGDAYEALECEPDEFTSLVGLLDRFEAAHTDLVEMVLADGDSWDRYAASQWWTLDRWLEDNGDDPRVPQVRSFLQNSRRSYLEYQRHFMGWGVFILRPHS